MSRARQYSQHYTVTSVQYKMADTEDAHGSYFADDMKSEALLAFINLYRNSPELWNPEHPSYTLKHDRQMALRRLQQIYTQIKTNATIDDVRRKINTLRSNYRKELKRMLQKQSGQNYSPSSWVFHQLRFLDILEDRNYNLPHEPEPFEPNQFDIKEESFENPQEQQFNLTDDAAISTSNSSHQPPFESTMTALRDGISYNRRDILLSKICKVLESTEDDQLPTICRVWGEKLKELDKSQRDLAEKAINDILFEAGQGTLTRHSVKIN